ncbi:MAG: MarR family winged helix-turn-helix transcriptional regulator [Desulfovibrionaceae bacterium]
MTPRHEDRPIEKLNRNIIEFFERLSSWEHAVIRGSNLTLPQAHTIEILAESGPLRMKELAGKMGVTTGTLTVQVDRLEKRGFVERRPHESDRRSILVALTAEGARRAGEHHALHLRLTEEITSELSAEELEALAGVLERMCARF